MAVKEKEQENHLQELGEQVKQCQEEMAQLETEKGKLRKETSQLRERALALEKQVNDKTETLRNLDKVGFPRHHLDRLRDRLSEEAISSLVDDISLQVVVQYLMIGLVWCRKNLNPKLRPPREITKKYYSIGQYTEVELADVLIWALLMLIGEVDSDKG